MSLIFLCCFCHSVKMLRWLKFSISNLDFPLAIPDIHIIFLLNFYFNNFPFGVDLCIFVSNASKTVGCLSPTFVAFVRGGGRVSGGIPSPPGYPIP